MANINNSSRLTRSDLADAWIKCYGRPPPKGLSTRLLIYAYHYNRQAKDFGGLKKSTLRQLRQHIPTSSDSGRKEVRVSRVPMPVKGSRLVREWRGKTHMVDIEENGFVFEGKTYRSLSAIARTITGARWSGPRFFGL